MALYNKYRPVNLDMIIGQEAVKRVLKGQFKRGDFSHAYLFTGKAGTGKTTVARILSAMLCDSGGVTLEPNLKDENVSQIFSGRSGIDVTEIDAASNRGIENAREIKKSADFPPINMRYKIWIIDECHGLTNDAWNAMLKIIEEPPKHVVFIFCTTEVAKVPETIKTRCTRLNFHELSTPDILGELKKISNQEELKARDDVLKMIASSAKGSMRQAINFLEHAFSTSEEVTPETLSAHLGLPTADAARRFVSSVPSKDFAGGIKSSSAVVGLGVRPEDFLGMVAECLHDVICCQSEAFSHEDYGYTQQDVKELSQIHDSCAKVVGGGRKQVMRLVRKWVDTTNWASKLVVYNTQPQNLMDVLWISMFDDLVQLKDLVNKEKSGT